MRKTSLAASALVSLAVIFFSLFLATFDSQRAFAYPPGVAILGKAKNCLACHINNGPWKDDAQNIIDIIDRDTGASLKQPDGTFLISAKRGEAKTVLTVIGRAKGGQEEPPYRNAWLYLDPRTIDSTSLSKFAPGWDVNLPMSCRLVGDKLEGREGARITVLPMTLRPTDGARDSELLLQIMLTKGESVKGKPQEGMIASYFERTVKLTVRE